MKFLEQIKADLNYENDIEGDYSKLVGIPQNYRIGTKIGWLYNDEIEWYKKEYKEDIKEYKDFDEWLTRGRGLQFKGILFTLPDEIFDIYENAVVCIYDYPIEKENPTCDWVSLVRLLSSKDLYKVFIL